ncbi:MAG: tetratricopeptide repeat protein, partial [bacterium]
LVVIEWQEVIQSKGARTMDPLSRNAEPGNQPEEEKDETVRAIIDSGNRHYNEALALAHAGRSDEALAQVQAAISLVGNQPAYYNLLGTIQAQKGFYSEAIDAWQRCLSLDPEMEKSARAIERARLMEEEAVEETRRRPYILWTTAAVLVAAFCFVGMAGLGWKAFRQGKSIASLEQQRDMLSNEKLRLEGNLAVYAKMSPDEWVAVQRQKDEAVTRAAELQRQLDSARTEHEKTLTGLNQQVGSIQADLEAKTKQYQDLVAKYEEAVMLRVEVEDLRSKLEAANGRAANQQRAASDARGESEKIREELLAAQQKIRDAENAGKQAVIDEGGRNMKSLQDLQQKMAAKEDEILNLRREFDNLKAANSKTILALKALEANEFEAAKKALDQALEYAAKDPLATMLHQEVSDVLSDPIEQARRREEASGRAQERIVQVKRYIDQYRSEGAGNLSKGHFDEAETSFRRALELAADEESKKEIQKLLGQAEEGKARLVLLIDEAHRAMEEGDLANAQAALKRVLKEQPDHSKAKKLLEEMAL